MYVYRCKVSGPNPGALMVLYTPAGWHGVGDVQGAVPSGGNKFPMSVATVGADRLHETYRPVSYRMLTEDERAGLVPWIFPSGPAGIRTARAAALLDSRRYFRALLGGQGETPDELTRLVNWRVRKLHPADEMPRKGVGA